jgi:hypothetical protein
LPQKEQRSCSFESVGRASVLSLPLGVWPDLSGRE